ncbi:WNT10A family protein [Megaselia abdita]
MSGSCQLKTCWKSAPNFHIVGRVLKHQFRRAILVDQSNLGNGEPLIVFKRDKNKTNAHKMKGTIDKHSNQTEKHVTKSAKKLESYLLYYQRSPNFCEKDINMDILGTAGRRCNKNSTLSDGCSSLCCGRGFKVVTETHFERCQCKFQWCCFVECELCKIEKSTSICI